MGSGTIRVAIAGAEGFYATTAALASRESADAGNTADIIGAAYFLD